MNNVNILQSLKIRPQPASLSQLVLKPKVNIANKKFPQQQLQQSLRDSDQQCFSKTTHLWLHWNEFDSIIDLLVPFKFTNLRILNVGGNHLTTIQSIQLLRMENLQQLFLWNNHITSLKPLRKTNLPTLNTLDLSGNPLIELTFIRQLNSRSIKRLVFESSKINDVVQSLVLFNLEEECTLEIANTNILKFKGTTIRTEQKENNDKFVYQVSLAPNKQHSFKYI